MQARQKSRTYRRKKIRTPSGTKLHYIKRKPKIAYCANCGKPLHGVARGRPYQIKKIPKSQRRPQRPYGGMLCSKCMREKIKELR